ncbi:MAG: 4-(cytidine 5'-diphospho)-2-C-methyl-D-erythritol kinase [Spirochaetota bacterium]|nr:4-(cytidine 5'-diphospho)-2-C-methyl-D-erythritol kinase [Spirochaetota bacterium]
MHLIDSFTSTSKINLYLDIVGRDPIDGYHYIESIYYEIPWGDDFEIYSSQQDYVEFIDISLEEIPQENTVTKALKLFKEKFKITESYYIKIKKNVPMGAGLGGGSGDAGSLLKWLARRFDIEITNCISIAQKIGSDVPFFLYGKMALVEGKGEIVTPLENTLKGMHLVIIYPNIHVSTKKAFEIIAQNNCITNSKSQQLKNLKKNKLELDNLKKLIYNIFNNSLQILNQDLYEFRKNLDDFLSPDIIMMTGSGSSFILFYQDKENMDHIKKKIAHNINHSKIFIHSI